MKEKTEYPEVLLYTALLMDALIGIGCRRENIFFVSDPEGVGLKIEEDGLRFFLKVGELNFPAYAIENTWVMLMRARVKGPVISDDSKEFLLKYHNADALLVKTIMTFKTAKEQKMRREGKDPRIMIQ